MHAISYKVELTHSEEDRRSTCQNSHWKPHFPDQTRSYRPPHRSCLKILRVFVGGGGNVAGESQNAELRRQMSTAADRSTD